MYIFFCSHTTHMIIVIIIHVAFPPARHLRRRANFARQSIRRGCSSSSSSSETSFFISHRHLFFLFCSPFSFHDRGYYTPRRFSRVGIQFDVSSPDDALSESVAVAAGEDIIITSDSTETEFSQTPFAW